MPTLSKIGRYEVLRELGHGSMGTVYLARDSKLGRMVALKTFRGSHYTDLEDSMALRRRVLREAQRAGTLSHPNVVTIYDVVESEAGEGSFFIVMEYVEGGGLDARLEQDGPVPLLAASLLVSQIAAALDHLHARGIVHRDIKPANVLVSDDNKVKLTDFGIARSEDPTATLETEIYGTPHYMSPEQVQGKPIDGRTDVFGLGVLLYEMLTGRKPFHGSTVAEVTHNVLYLPMLEPMIGDRPLPGPLHDLLGRALAKDPAQRFTTAGALAAALARIAEGHSELDAADTAAMPRSKWMAMLAASARAHRKSRLPWRVLAAVVPAALLLGGGLVYLTWDSAVEEAPIAADAQARQIGYVKLMAEGRRLMASGDPHAAAVLFQTAEGLAGDPTAAQRLRRQAEQSAVAGGASLPDDADEFAAARELLGPGRPEARRVLSEVERALGRPPRRLPAAPAPVAAPTATVAAAVLPATLIVELHSEAPEGVVRVWVDQAQVLDRSFSFYDRRYLLFRKAVVPGGWSSELQLDGGDAVSMRILVARSGDPATVRTLEAALPGGERRTLAIHVPAAGDASVELR